MRREFWICVFEGPTPFEAPTHRWKDKIQVDRHKNDVCLCVSVNLTQSMDQQRALVLLLLLIFIPPPPPLAFSPISCFAPPAARPVLIFSNLVSSFRSSSPHLVFGFRRVVFIRDFLPEFVVRFCCRQCLLPTQFCVIF